MKADSVPLTFGQLSVWRVMADWPHSRWPETYLTGAVELPPGCGEDRVVSAFGALRRRHESLRTRFTDTADGPVQRVDDAAGDPVVGHVERQVTTVEEAAAAGRELAQDRIDRAREHAYRFAVVTSGGRSTHAVITTDHIVADGFSMGRLRAELTALTGGDSPEGSRWLEEEPPQPRALALAQRSAAGRARGDGVLRHWRDLLATLPPDAFPVPDDAGGSPGRIEAVLRSPRARAALAVVARERGLAPHDVLLALTSLALAVLEESARVVMTLQSSNRFGPPWHTVVSSMNQYAPMVLDTGTAAGTFDEWVRRVQRTALKAYRFGSYDIDAVDALVRGDRGRAPGYDNFYNFLAHDVAQSAPVPGAVRAGRVERTRPHRQIGPRFDVKVLGGPDMPVVVRADPALVPADRLDALLTWFDEEAHRLAAEPAGSTAALVRRCRAALEGPSAVRPPEHAEHAEHAVERPVRL
ncbi:condensation domain-containing protein [Streptomyces sp. NPDC002908]|uniref:condensation domain-containing protein n=1 Tax=Streptomyces sp. NPDC002908 TaxID=3364670 RepID=UPI00368CC002